MRNDEDRPPRHFMKVMEHADKILEAPKINACFRLIQAGKFGTSCEHHGDLDPIQLAARKALVERAVDIVKRAKADL